MMDTLISVFRISVKAIFANKMRSALTSLGIVIGVAAVITMLAVGSGTQQEMTERFSRFGTNVLFLAPAVGSGREHFLPQRRYHGRRARHTPYRRGGSRRAVYQLRFYGGIRLYVYVRQRVGYGYGYFSYL